MRHLGVYINYGNLKWMRCLLKNRECPHAGSLKMIGVPEWGEREGIFEYAICYNDEIGRDVTKCK